MPIAIEGQDNDERVRRWHIFFVVLTNPLMTPPIATLLYSIKFSGAISNNVTGPIITRRGQQIWIEIYYLLNLIFFNYTWMRRIQEIRLQLKSKVLII